MHKPLHLNRHLSRINIVRHVERSRTATVFRRLGVTSLSDMTAVTAAVTAVSVEILTVIAIVVAVGSLVRALQVLD